VDGLAGLIDRLFRGEKDGGLVLKLDRQRVIGGPDGRVGDEVELAIAGAACGKAEVCLDGAVAIEAAGEKANRGLIGAEKVNVDGAGLGRIAVGRGGEDADGGSGSAMVSSQTPAPLRTSTRRSMLPREWSSGSSTSTISLPEPACGES